MTEEIVQIDYDADLESRRQLKKALLAKKDEKAEPKESPSELFMKSRKKHFAKKDFSHTWRNLIWHFKENELIDNSDLIYDIIATRANENLIAPVGKLKRCPNPQCGYWMPAES